MRGEPEYLPAEDISESKDPSISLFQMSMIIIFGIFATTLAQPIVLGNLPLKLFLKNELHESKTAVSSFFFLSALAWYFKPFAGILTDAFPLFRTRRRHYLMISAALAAATWIVIGIIPHTYLSLLYGCITLSAFMVIASTVTGAYLVESGQKLKATGRLTSVRQTVQNLCSVFQGYAGGLLAAQVQSGGFFLFAGINALIAGSVIPVAFLFLRERPVPRNYEVLTTAKEQLRTILRSRSLWFAILFLGLFYFVPGFNTVLTYKQTDELGFKPQQIGFLASLQGVTGIIAAILYGFLIRRFNIRTLIVAGVALNALGTLFYLFYNGFTVAMFIDAQNNFFFTLCEVALIDLAARSTPAGCEGLGYSLILSVRNVASQGADVLGSWLSDHHWEYKWLVFLNSGTTAAVLILVPLIPATILRSRDTNQPQAA